MTLQQLIYFQEVAQVGSYTIAAQNLYVSPSNISYSIRELETELHAHLFLRSGGKRVSLTSLGECFLPYVTRALTTLEEGQAELAQKSAHPSSQFVKIGYSHVTSFSIVEKIFENFGCVNDIILQFVVNNVGYSFFSTSLLGNMIDLSFSSYPPFGSIEGVPIAKQELSVMLPMNHPLAERELLSVIDIKDEPFIWYKTDGHIVKDVEKIFESENVTPNITHYAAVNGDWFEHISQIAFQRGISIVPKVAVAIHNNCKIKVVPLDSPLRFREIYLQWAKNKPLSVAAQYVRDYCIDYCTKYDIIDGQATPKRK